MEILDSRRLGGAWTLDRLWERLGIGAAIRRAAAGRRLDADAVERVIFTLVAQRALEPGSKLAATRWVAERVAIERLTGLSDDQAYRAMDFLLDALDEIAARDLQFRGAPAEPGSRHRLRGHHLDLLGDRDRRRAARTGRPGRRRRHHQPGRARRGGRSDTPRTSAPTCPRW